MKKQKLISLLLTVLMLCSLLPAGALAEEVPATCVCSVKCTDTVNSECPVCANDAGACVGSEPQLTAEEEAPTPVCTCSVKCTDTVNSECPVCANDSSACAGSEPEAPAVCTCGTKCAEDAVNSECPVCAADISACAGSEPQLSAEAECTCTEACTAENTNSNCPVCVNDISACTGLKTMNTFRVQVTVSGNGRLELSPEPNSVTEEDGTVTYVYNPGTKISVLATPNAGCYLDTLKLNGGSVNEIKDYEVERDLTIDAEFLAYGVLTVTQPTEGGTISCSPDPASKSGDTYYYKQGTQVSAMVTLSEGYLLREWVINGQETADTSTTTFVEIGANSQTVTAKLEKACVVKFDVNNSKCTTEIIDQEVLSGDTAESPSDPTAKGYVFKGWYTDKDGTNAYDFNTPVTGDLTLYAKWTASISLKTTTSNSYRSTITSPSKTTVTLEYGSGVDCKCEVSSSSYYVGSVVVKVGSATVHTGTTGLKKSGKVYTYHYDYDNLTDVPAGSTVTVQFVIYSGSSPATGDSSNILLWSGMSVLAVGAAAVLFLLRRKTKKN